MVYEVCGLGVGELVAFLTPGPCKGFFFIVSHGRLKKINETRFLSSRALILHALTSLFYRGLLLAASPFFASFTIFNYDAGARTQTLPGI